MTTVALVASMGFALVGCGSSDETVDPADTTVSESEATSPPTTSSPPTTTRSTTTSTITPTEAQLRGMLLGVDELPPGWRIRRSTSSGDDTGTPECLRRFDASASGRPSAGIEFELGDARYLNEDLTWVGTGIEESFRDAVAAADGCGNLTVDVGDGVQADVTITRTSSPPAGDESATYHMTMLVKGVQADFDILMARRDAYVMVLMVGAIGGGDTAGLLEQLAPRALAKLPASA